jgi:hypothetical protein
MTARLIFLGAADGTSTSTLTDAGTPLRVNDPVALTLKYAHRWTREDVTRVIVGSNPDRADVLLVDEPLTIGGEHVRFYLNHADPPASHLRPMKNAPVTINGELQKPFEWIHPKNGDEILLGKWRFRFETKG